jgi:hypothetical protein
MVAMMNKITAGDSKSGKTTGDSASGSSGKKGDRRRTYQPCDNDKDGKRTARRYNNDNYCWTCGFDISHTSSTCKWIKDIDNHKKEATAANTLGGSQRNMQLRTT